jgi:hypothetical protein
MKAAQGKEYPAGSMGSGMAFGVRIPGLLQIPFVERLIYYLLVTDIVSRLLFEVFLGYNMSNLSQQRLWIFSGLIAIEYIFQIRRVLHSRFYIDRNMYAACFVIILVLHGLFLGIGWHNNTVKVATDTIPLFIGAINILLACQVDAYKNFNFNRVEALNITFALIMLTLGIIALLVGRATPKAGLGSAVSTTVSIAIITVSFWRRNVFGIIFLIINFSILSLSAPFFNRTTLAFIIIAALIVFYKNIIKSPLKLYLSIILIAVGAVCVPLIVPPDSPLGRRIHELGDSEELEQQKKTGTGSIGDRFEEWSIIQKKVSQGGPIAKIFGFGHGATYFIIIDGNYNPTYSNAHYGWALFYLRYGYCGFLYLCIYAALIMANIAKNNNSTDNFNRFIILIGIGAILYIFSYMAFDILIFGLQFMHRRTCAEKVTVRERAFVAPARMGLALDQWRRARPETSNFKPLSLTTAVALNRGSSPPKASGPADRQSTPRKWNEWQPARFCAKGIRCGRRQCRRASDRCLRRFGSAIRLRDGKEIKQREGFCLCGAPFCLFMAPTAELARSVRYRRSSMRRWRKSQFQQVLGDDRRPPAPYHMLRRLLPR